MSNGLIDKDFLLESRREAYITAIENKMENDNVIGYFGYKIPEEVFYAFSLIPFPFEGVDPYIFEFGYDEGLCQPLNSTITYLKTEKCPIIFSCRLFVLEDFCKTMPREIQKYTDKKILIYENEEKLKNDLAVFLNKKIDEEKYEEAKERLHFIDEVLERIDKDKNITTEEAFLLRYYTKYMRLEDRYKYFKEIEEKYEFKIEDKKIIKKLALCPMGGYRSILGDYSEDEILRIYFGSENVDYSYENCPIKHKNNIMYEV